MAGSVQIVINVVCLEEYILSAKGLQESGTGILPGPSEHRLNQQHVEEPVGTSIQELEEQ